MKKLYLIFFTILSFSLSAQYYTTSDFLLKGSVNRVSVICYDFEELDGEFQEGLPYSTQNRYHTDLNLHYLEFNKDGELIRSKLYYPRDFYGQFSWLSPQFDLESSDYSEKKNYLAAMYRYKYFRDEDNLKIIITAEDGTKVNVVLDKTNSLKEDEYYTYNINAIDDKEVLTKKRKGSLYGFRRLETIYKDDKKVINEYINNRFLVSKKVELETSNSYESIYLSQSSIELIKLEKKSGIIIKKNYVSLSWRNKFLKWPEIDFDIELDYTSFLNMLERESDEYGEEYEYDSNGNIVSLKRYKYGYDNKKEVLNIKYFYEDNRLTKLVLNPDPTGDSDLFFKEYKYDNKGNWNIKIVGYLKRVKGEEKRVPTKKYVKSISYWN